MKRFSVIGCAMLSVALLGAGQVLAQLDQGVSAKDLVDPWARAQAVLLSLGPSLDAVVEPDQRAELDAKLSKLGDQLAALQSKQETVAIQIASNPAFAYDAAVSSAEMSEQVSEVEEGFDSLFGDLMLRERPDVRAMQQSIESLRQVLRDKNRFERDVQRAIASGGRNEIQALAARWWTGAEGIGGVREAIAEVRRRLAAPSGGQRPN
jgi:hypothetical protein